MIVVDTNVLAYAVGREHPLRAHCRSLVDAIATGRVTATTTTEVIQELLHIRARSRGRDDATSVGREFVNLLEPLIVTDQKDLEAGLRLFERLSTLNAFDAVLAAAAIERNVDALVSADGAFASVPRLTHVAPGTPAFEMLLAATS